MFDTVALSQTSTRRPDREALERSNAVYLCGRDSTNPYRILVNPEEGSHEPRITITPRPNGQYICRPEVSVGAMLHGSSLHLPSPDDLLYFFGAIDEYVGQRTGLVMNSRNARVARLDVTKDFKIDPQTVLRIIDNYRHFRFPKRTTILIDSTTVCFDSKGKKLSRQGTLYSKYHERLAHSASAAELEMAMGILRAEDRYRTNQSVADLAKSLMLPNHHAETLLTEVVYQAVIDKFSAKLGIDAALKNESGRIEEMYHEYGHVRAGRIMEHLALERSDKRYYLNPIFDISERTAKDRSKAAVKFGLIRLE